MGYAYAYLYHQVQFETEATEIRIAGYVAVLEEDGLPVPKENFETFLVLV